MDLKEFLISIGRLPREEKTLDNLKHDDSELLQADDESTSTKYQTVGEMYNYYKKLGYEKVPYNAQ